MFNEVTVKDFLAELAAQERSRETIDKYGRDVRRFLADMEGREITREAVAAWRDLQKEQGYATSSVNTMLAAVNRFLDFAGMPQCKAKQLKVQRRVFRESERELTLEEYERLVAAASERTALIMETMGGTGIRVGEIHFITVEAAQSGFAEIRLKGKVRTILIPGKLCRKLIKYAKKQKIASGEIFLTRNGNPISRRQIWAEMKAASKKAGVDPRKVFPHNLRHLFARQFYRKTKNIVMLADVLGHSSIETTRIYLISTGKEHEKILDNLKLVS